MDEREERGGIKRRANWSGIDYTVNLSNTSVSKTAISKSRQIMSNILILEEIGDVLQLQLPARIHQSAIGCDFPAISESLDAFRTAWPHTHTTHILTEGLSPPQKNKNPSNLAGAKWRKSAV